MPGHVFVIRGDMRRLNCDAWPIPCDAKFWVVPTWLETPRGANPATAAYFAALRAQFQTEQISYRGILIKRLSPRPDALVSTEGWSADGVRVSAFANWNEADGPRPWMLNVGSRPDRPISWYMDALQQYLEAVNAAVGAADYVPRGRRVRPLVAIHAAGTGHGGARWRRAEIIWHQLKLMQTFVARDDCAMDVVFVAWEEGTFAAAQACRRTNLRAPSEPLVPDDDPPGRLWPELSEAQRETARHLAARAASGNLVLFLGAGVSVPAGLPSWNDLLREAASDRPELEDSLSALTTLDPLDQAQLIERYTPDLRDRVASQFEIARYALGHALLACLPVNEMVTQNYDRLLETAAEVMGRPVAVIPGTRVADESRWLLKMHGSVDRPQEIVLTREDYLRYAERRAALAGIVQALLITKHMLFVGFSLRDPNFHRIADDVRKVLRPEANADTSGTFGTVLLVQEDPLRQRLWEHDLEIQTLSAPAAPAAVGAAARLHDIFLDYLLYESTASASYLMDPSYEHALSPDERELRDALADLRRFKGPLGGSPTWEAVERLLREVGGTFD